MATDSSRDPLRSEAAPLLKARGAASSLEGLVRLLARQAAREAIASGRDKARSEVNPAAVELSAGKYLRQHWGIPCSEKTLAKLACVGGGPAYHRFGRIPLYTVADLDEFAQAKISKPVRSTSEYGVD